MRAPLVAALLTLALACSGAGTQDSAPADVPAETASDAAADANPDTASRDVLPTDRAESTGDAPEVDVAETPDPSADVPVADEAVDTRNDAEAYDPCAHAGEPCEIVNVWGTCPGVVYCSTGTAICDGLAPEKESCDHVDNNCDGKTDEGFVDTNGDGIPDAGCPHPDDDNDGVMDYLDNCPKVPNYDQANWDTDHLGTTLGDNLGDACDPDDDNDGVSDIDDCSPKDEKVYPGAVEACDLVDNDCDTVTDEGWPDSDGDGHPDACWPDEDDGDGVPDDVDNCPLVANPDQADWDGDGVGNECDVEVYLPVTIEEVLWMGYFPDTAEFLETLPPDSQGPDVLVDGATVTVRWRAAVYEDCREPDTFALTDEGSTLRLRLVDTECVSPYGEVGMCLCGDNDYVSTVSASFEHAPGTFSVTVECLVSGFSTGCGPAETFEISIL